MGHRMELYVNPNAAQEIVNISKSFGVNAKVIGRVETSDTKKLTIKSEHGTFEY
jgi:phosphoribosylformylglycinamidine cyclo-ligase